MRTDGIKRICFPQWELQLYWPSFKFVRFSELGTSYKNSGNDVYVTFGSTFRLATYKEEQADAECRVARSGENVMVVTSHRIQVGFKLMGFGFGVDFPIKQDVFS